MAGWGHSRGTTLEASPPSWCLGAFQGHRRRPHGLRAVCRLPQERANMHPHPQLRPQVVGAWRRFTEMKQVTRKGLACVRAFGHGKRLLCCVSGRAAVSGRVWPGARGCRTFAGRVPAQSCAPPRQAQRPGRPLPVWPFPQHSLVHLPQAVTWVVTMVQGGAGDTGPRVPAARVAQACSAPGSRWARRGVSEWEGASLPSARHEGALGWASPARRGCRGPRRPCPAGRVPEPLAAPGVPGTPGPGVSGCPAPQGTGQACRVRVACARPSPWPRETCHFPHPAPRAHAGVHRLGPHASLPSRAGGRLTRPGRGLLWRGAADTPARRGRS